MPGDKNLELCRVDPQTENQKLAFNTYKTSPNLFMIGSAGTGKTYIALYLALKEALSSQFEQEIMIMRSAVATRNIGFLPGKQASKESVHEMPYKQICTKLFGRGDAYQILKSKKHLHFTTNSFLRGETFDDTILILDEAQNFNWHELNSIFTRIGENSRIIVCGDYKQSDLKREKSGINLLTQVVAAMPQYFGPIINFTNDDIVRSGFVKDFLITRDRLQLDRNLNGMENETGVGQVS